MAHHSLGGTSSKESKKSGLPAQDVLQIIGRLISYSISSVF